MPCKLVPFWCGLSANQSGFQGSTLKYGGLNCRGGSIQLYKRSPSDRRTHRTGIRIPLSPPWGEMSSSSPWMKIAATAPASCALRAHWTPRSLNRQSGFMVTSKSAMCPTTCVFPANEPSAEVGGVAFTSWLWKGLRTPNLAKRASNDTEGPPGRSGAISICPWKSWSGREVMDAEVSGRWAAGPALGTRAHLAASPCASIASTREARTGETCARSGAGGCGPARCPRCCSGTRPRASSPRQTRRARPAASSGAAAVPNTRPRWRASEISSVSRCSAPTPRTCSRLRPGPLPSTSGLARTSLPSACAIGSFSAAAFPRSSNALLEAWNQKFAAWARAVAWNLNLDPPSPGIAPTPFRRSYHFQT
eukprot:2347573-Rhodomonas_salina.3